LHKIVNDMRVKYRTYYTEFDAHYVSMHSYFSSFEYEYSNMAESV